MKLPAMIRRFALTLCLLTVQASPGATPSLDITAAHGSATEIQTKDELQRLLDARDLSAWIFTRTVVIDDKAIPHSHPVLTLHARHLGHDDLLLSTFLHEQLHWFLAQKDQQTQAAIEDLHRLFPKVPVGYPEGAMDEPSTYLHLIVNYLEYQSDKKILGDSAARQVMDYWAGDHYTWVYKMVLERPDDIAGVVQKHGLIPTGLDTPAPAKQTATGQAGA